VNDRCGPLPYSWRIEGEIEVFRANSAPTRLEPDAVRFHDGRTEPGRSDTCSWQLFAKSSNDKITLENTVFLEAVEVLFRDVSLRIVEDTVSDILKSNDSWS
jgi:hypothetical protein